MCRKYIIILGLLLFFRAGNLIADNKTSYIELTEKAGSFAELYSTFQKPPDNCKSRAIWWWFDNAVTKEEIELELTEMWDKGMGAAEIYSISHYVHKTVLPGAIEFASEEWVQMVHYAIQKAKELGMKIDVTNIMGYPIGGIHVPANSVHSAQCIMGPSLEDVRYVNFDIKFDGREGGYCLNL